MKIQQIGGCTVFNKFEAIIGAYPESKYFFKISLSARFRNRLRGSEELPSDFPDRLLSLLDKATMYELSDAIGPNLIQVLLEFKA